MSDFAKMLKDMSESGLMEVTFRFYDKHNAAASNVPMINASGSVTYTTPSTFPPAPMPLGATTIQPVPEMKAEDLMKPLSALDDFTPEEIMMYATPRFDEIQAEKEAHKQKLAEEKV